MQSKETAKLPTAPAGYGLSIVWCYVPRNGVARSTRDSQQNGRMKTVYELLVGLEIFTRPLIQCKPHSLSMTLYFIKNNFSDECRIRTSVVCCIATVLVCARMPDHYVGRSAQYDDKDGNHSMTRTVETLDLK